MTSPRARLKLFIVGAGGFGREVLWTASEVPERSRDWDIAGFLDDDVDGARKSFLEKGVATPVTGSVRDHQPRDDELFVCALEAPRDKLAACESLRGRGAAFGSVRHPTALVHPSATLGIGVILRQYTGVGPNAIVGDFVSVNLLGGPAHDAIVGDGCTLGAHSDIMGGAVLGRGVWLGSHAVVLPGARIGDYATVGVGSVVIRRVDPGATVFGVPARRLVFVPTITGEERT